MQLPNFLVLKRAREGDLLARGTKQRVTVAPPKIRQKVVRRCALTGSGFCDLHATAPRDLP